MYCVLCSFSAASQIRASDRIAGLLPKPCGTQEPKLCLSKQHLPFLVKRMGLLSSLGKAPRLWQYAKTEVLKPKNQFNAIHLCVYQNSAIFSKVTVQLIFVSLIVQLVVFIHWISRRARFSEGILYSTLNPPS